MSCTCALKTAINAAHGDLTFPVEAITGLTDAHVLDMGSR